MIIFSTGCSKTKIKNEIEKTDKNQIFLNENFPIRKATCEQAVLRCEICKIAVIKNLHATELKFLKFNFTLNVV